MVPVNCFLFFFSLVGICNISDVTKEMFRKFRNLLLNNSTDNRIAKNVILNY